MSYSINERINIRSRYGLKTKLDFVKLKEVYATNNVDSIRSPKGSMPNDYDWTRPRDFFNMPISEFELTDKIWNYTVKKFLNEKGEESWLIREKGSFSGSTCWLYTYDERVSERYYETWTRKLMKCNINMCGLHIHSDECYNIITRLMIIPRGSFKKYVTQEIVNDFYEMMA